MAVLPRSLFFALVKKKGEYDRIAAFPDDRERDRDRPENAAIDAHFRQKNAVFTCGKHKQAI